MRLMDPDEDQVCYWADWLELTSFPSDPAVSYYPGSSRAYYEMEIKSTIY